ncbi:zinc finger MYM-type protein 1-like, partial [Myzus persicae]|uniref:zinc finger MYM-type protein 1-like n=1 Tax=Myzus persicae TaxID=13164 RepID=UPI000B931C5B
MSQVIRYVVVNENGCEIVESFLGFLQVFKKTGEAITEDILRSLSNHSIDLSYCRGQSYDNGANMAGKWKGVQARISSINSLARFIPCTAHSLNLVGLYAAKCSPELEQFFGIVQKLFNFFSSSTQRWDILKQHLKFSMKGYSTTRWSAKQRAVKSLYLQLGQVIHVCKLLKNSNLCEEASVELNDIATQHLKGLIHFIEKFREEGIDEALDESKQKSTELSIEPVFPSIRVRKKKKMPGELAEDESSTLSEENKFKILMKNVCDRILNELDSFTQHAIQLDNKLINASSHEILNFILKNGLQEAYPNIFTAYQIFLTLP